jgi:hypothetical protein
MRWTKTTITLVIIAAAVLIGAGGATLGLAVGGKHAVAALPAQSPAAAASQAPKASTAPAKPPAPAPQPTKTVTAPPPQVIINNNPPAYQAPPQVAAPPPGTFTDGEDPANVVVNYYNDISAKDFADAWNMGGSSIAAQNGQTYSSWVAGYDGTGPESASTYDEGTDGQGNEVVHTDIYPAGASSPSYTGWYAVNPASMTIVSGYLQKA